VSADGVRRPAGINSSNLSGGFRPNFKEHSVNFREHSVNFREHSVNFREHAVRRSLSPSSKADLDALKTVSGGKSTCPLLKDEECAEVQAMIGARQEARVPGWKRIGREDLSSGMEKFRRKRDEGVRKRKERRERKEKRGYNPSGLNLRLAHCSVR